ncbi:MAG: hypothetical protein ACPIOQ_40785 [Promethearchaeia archaeon]
MMCGTAHTSKNAPRRRSLRVVTMWRGTSPLTGETGAIVGSPVAGEGQLPGQQGHGGGATDAEGRPGGVAAGE